jgi:hypothetical protein
MTSIGSRYAPTPALVVAEFGQVFIYDGVNIVLEMLQDCRKAKGKVFVQLDSHRICGVAGTG